MSRPFSPASIKAFMAARTEQIQKEVGGAGLLSEVAELQLKYIKERFLKHISPTGAKWSESTASRRRRKKRGTNSTLQDTGRLYNSLAIRETQRGGLAVYINDPAAAVYGRIHHFGGESTTVSGAKIQNPARPFLFATKKDERRAFNTMRSRFKRRFK